MPESTTYQPPSPQNWGSSGKPRSYALTAAAVVIACVLLFPVYWMIVNSLETDKAIFSIPVPLIPRHLTFSSYRSVIGDQLPHLGTSLIVALGTALLSLALAAPAAYALAHFRIRNARLLLFALLLAQMIPTVTLATPMFLIFNKLGLLNSYIGLIFADSTYAVPFDTLILFTFFQSVPFDLAEAAQIDGAGEWGAFLRVMLPLAAPGLVTAGLFAFLFAWGDFLYALTLMTTNDIQPISLSLYSYIGQFNAAWNHLMAVATLAAIPSGILLLAFQRYISAGLAAGALKG